MPCGIIHQIVWDTSVNSLALILKTINLFLPCKLIFWKATKVGSPPDFPKLISQLRGIPQPQYFVPSLLEPHWTYLWKYYIYHKKDTKVGSQILATKFGFVPDWLYNTAYKQPILDFWSAKKNEKKQKQNHSTACIMNVEWKWKLRSKAKGSLHTWW